MAILTQFGLACTDFAQGAASFRNYASQMRYKHPWCAQSHAPTILFLPSVERGLFQVDDVSHLDNVMSQLAMQTLAVGGEAAFRVGVLAPGRLVAFALLPLGEGFATLLRTPLFVVMLG